MPLVKTTLSTALRAVFESYPATAQAAGVQFADAVASYAAGIAPPSTSQAAAKTALGAALGSAFGVFNGAPPLMESAFATYGAALGSGMAGYVAVPPAGPVGFVAYFGGPYPATAQAAAADLADRIDQWMRTGTAALISPPGAALPWA